MGRKPKQKQEFITPSADALVGNFEAWYDLHEKVVAHNDAKKDASKMLAAHIKEYASEVGCKDSDLRNAFKYWMDLKYKGESTKEEQFELMALVDVYYQGNPDEL